MSKSLSSIEHHFSDNTWIDYPMSEADARRLVITELGGIWTETRVDGSAFLASILAHAVKAGDLTSREAETLIRYTCDVGRKPAWLPSTDPIHVTSKS